MKLLAPALVGVLALATLSTATAEIYQWKDANGRTVISDTPPPGNAKEVRAAGTKPSAAPASAAGDGKTLAEKDMDFKKRQQENKDKADKAAKEEAAAQERKENCSRAQRQLSALESGIRISTTDAGGERRFMEDNERQAEIERTRRAVSETCK